MRITNKNPFLYDDDRFLLPLIPSYRWNGCSKTFNRYLWFDPSLGELRQPRYPWKISNNSNTGIFYENTL